MSPESFPKETVEDKVERWVESDAYVYKVLEVEVHVGTPPVSVVCEFLDQDVGWCG